MKKDYIIPVEWTIVKNVKVSAESLDEAKELAAFTSVETGTYLDDSFRINEELLEEFEGNRKMNQTLRLTRITLMSTKLALKEVIPSTKPLTLYQRQN